MRILHKKKAVAYRGKPARQTRGFTLLEVVIALFIFALVTVMFAASMIASTATSGMNGQYAQALSLCQHKIDQCRAMGFGKLTYDELKSPDNIIDATPTTQPYSFTQIDGVANMFALKDAKGNIVANTNPTTSLAIATTADARVLKVTVTISWKSSSKRATNSTASLVGYVVNTE